MTNSEDKDSNLNDLVDYTKLKSSSAIVSELIENSNSSPLSMDFEILEMDEPDIVPNFTHKPKNTLIASIQNGKGSSSAAYLEKNLSKNQEEQAEKVSDTFFGQKEQDTVITDQRKCGITERETHSKESSGYPKRNFSMYQQQRTKSEFPVNSNIKKSEQLGKEILSTKQADILTASHHVAADKSCNGLNMRYSVKVHTSHQNSIKSYGLPYTFSITASVRNHTFQTNLSRRETTDESMMKGHWLSIDNTYYDKPDSIVEIKYEILNHERKSRSKSSKNAQKQKLYEFTRTSANTFKMLGCFFVALLAILRVIEICNFSVKDSPSCKSYYPSYTTKPVY